jgi:hypothetical protein
MPDGTEVDLTREQFASNEVVQEPQSVRRPAGLPTRGAQQYLTMRHHVLTALGILEAEGTTDQELIRCYRDESVPFRE